MTLLKLVAEYTRKAKSEGEHKLGQIDSTVRQHGEQNRDRLSKCNQEHVQKQR